MIINLPKRVPVKISDPLDPDSLKIEGNAHYEARNYIAAVDSYTRGITAAKELLVTLFANRAAVYLKLFKFNAALQDCEAALELDPSHAKAAARKLLAIDGISSTQAEEHI